MEIGSNIYFVFKPQLAEPEEVVCPFHQSYPEADVPGGRCGCFSFLRMRDKKENELTVFDLHLMDSKGRTCLQLVEEAHG